MIAMHSRFFFLTLFFRSVPVNTFASTIDGIRRTLTVVNGETLNAILNRAIVNNRRCSVNRLEMGQNNLRREIVNETSVPESIVNVDLSLGCPVSSTINKTFIYRIMALFICNRKKEEGLLKSICNYILYFLFM